MKNITTQPATNCHIATILSKDLICGDIIDFVFRDINEATEAANHRLIVNFKNVERCSSSVLGKLVALRKKVMNAKGRLTLCCPSGNLEEAMKVTGLRRLFDMFDEEEAAIEYMSQDIVAWKPGAEL